MSTAPQAEPYPIPDAIQYLVQKERERIIAQLDQPAGDTSFKAAVEQYMAWKQQLAELESFMSHFGISFY